jgi:CHAT domain-containing protein
LVSPERLDILLTLPAVRRAHQIAVSKTELNREIEALRAALRDPRSQPAARARVLYERLLAPIAAELRKAGVQVLMLYLDEALRYLPFAALHDGAHYLVQDYALSVYTAAAANAVITRPKPDWQVAGLGLSRAQPGFEPLKAVSEELEGIVRHGADDPNGVLPGVVQLDDAFTEEALRARFAEGFEVVHVASHFVFTPGTYRESFLLLGDGTRVNLHTLDSYRLSGIELLTLSACDTAVGGGKDAQGREVEGLATLTLRKGAKGVLATLWTVADRSTALFMQKLYSLHADGHLSKAEALRRTQQAFLDGSVRADSDATRGKMLVGANSVQQAGAGASRDYRHPYYWAPFILMGNWQ